MISQGRKKARIFLLQVIYSEIFLQNTDTLLFRETYQDENNISSIDEEYFLLMKNLIHANISELLAIISELSTKFEIQKLPKIHIAILLIALAEMKFWDKWDIDDKISVNEAINLAKLFSDESGAKFISWTLWNFYRNKEKYQNLKPSNYQLFS